VNCEHRRYLNTMYPGVFLLTLIGQLTTQLMQTLRLSVRCANSTCFDLLYNKSTRIEVVELILEFILVVADMHRCMVAVWLRW